jgi:hypothetical protein
LFLPLDRHERVFADLGSGISRRGDDGEGTRCFASRSCSLLHLLHVVASENGVDTSLAKEECLARVFITPAVVGSLVHPFHTINLLLAPGGLQLLLSLFDLPLAPDFLEPSFGELALLQCRLLGVVHAALIGHQLGMP